MCGAGFSAASHGPNPVHRVPRPIEAPVPVVGRVVHAPGACRNELLVTGWSFWGSPVALTRVLDADVNRSSPHADMPRVANNSVYRATRCDHHASPGVPLWSRSPLFD